MKKSLFTIALGAMALAACQQGVNNQYTVSGTVEGLQDGDTLLIQILEGRNSTPIDTAVVQNGTFTFNGTTDTTAMRYLTSEKARLWVPFFLEKGNIRVEKTKGSMARITGTTNNDLLTESSLVGDSLQLIASEAWRATRDTTLTEAQQKELADAAQKKGEAVTEYQKKFMEQNLTNPVGLHYFVMLCNAYGAYTNEEKEALYAQLPEAFKADADVVKIKQVIDANKRTAVGQPFPDFEMPSMTGETVKVSDVVKQNKLTLLDFWASWCGPCCMEIPEIVKLYDRMKAKGFNVVSISLDDKEENWKKAVKELKMTWTQLSDLKGGACPTADEYGIQYIPFTVLVDQNGLIVARDIHGEDLEKKVEELLK